MYGPDGSESGLSGPMSGLSGPVRVTCPGSRPHVRAVRAKSPARPGHMSGLSGPHVRVVRAKVLGVRVGGTKMTVFGGPK